MSAPTPDAQTRAWFAITREIVGLILIIIAIAGVGYTLHAWNDTAFWTYLFIITGVVGYKLAGR